MRENDNAPQVRWTSYGLFPVCAGWQDVLRCTPKFVQAGDGSRYHMCDRGFLGPIDGADPLRPHTHPIPAPGTPLSRGNSVFVSSPYSSHCPTHSSHHGRFLLRLRPTGSMTPACSYIFRFHPEALFRESEVTVDVFWKVPLGVEGEFYFVRIFVDFLKDHA